MGCGDHGDADVLERVDGNYRRRALVRNQTKVGSRSGSLCQSLLLGERGGIVIVDYHNGSLPLRRIIQKVVSPMNTKCEPPSVIVLCVRDESDFKLVIWKHYIS